MTVLHTGDSGVVNRLTGREHLKWSGRDYERQIGVWAWCSWLHRPPLYLLNSLSAELLGLSEFGQGVC